MLKRGKGLLTVGLGVMFALFLTGTVHADLIVGGQWYEFSFSGVGFTAANCSSCFPGLLSIDSGDPPWVLAPGTPVVVTITDAFLSGDVFSLTDFGAVVGTTSAPTLGFYCANDEVLCLAHPAFSHAFIPLGGAIGHSLNIRVDASPSGGGAAFFRVDSVAAVPEPSAFLLLAIGLLGIAWWRYRATP